jgi:hypothetical protein
MAEIFKFPEQAGIFPKSEGRVPIVDESETGPAPRPGSRLYGPHRSREAVQRDIDAHIHARKVYGQAVAWLAAAEAENLPQANIEAARSETQVLYQEMQEAARHLLISMPTDPKALVDLLMYLEKNFSILPLELTHGASGCQSLAFDLLRTVRLSLRWIAKYGKHGPTS